MFLFKEKKNKEEETRLRRNITANEFINIKDIKDSIVYSRDNHIHAYIKISPMSLELLSNTKQKIEGKKFTVQFSSSEVMYKFITLSRPVDVSFMIEHYTNKLNGTNDNIRKKLLVNKIKELNDIAISGDILEHQFYLHLWNEYKKDKDSEKDLLRQANEFLGKFSNLKLEAKLCTRSDIVKLYNLFSNPNYAHLEDEDIEEYIPFVE
ncbi:MAG: hypothetical protein FWF57_01420 [Defluviitaleaceae bacterium]|nr:hypothetical protein [Defluviitaleaceae bacterium]